MEEESAFIQDNTVGSNHTGPVSNSRTEKKTRSRPCRSLNRCSNLPLLVIIIILILILLILILILALRPCGPVNENSTIPDKSDNSDKTYLALDGTPFPYQKIRVPSAVIPVVYTITLHPNMTFDPPNYTGLVEIEAVCQESTDFIVLHSLDLTIKVVKVIELESKQSLDVEDVVESPRLEQLYIKLGSECSEKLKIMINIEFNGTLTTRLDGFYLSQYKTKQGQHKKLGTTHMEPTAARRAFPCFDEPALKANFTLKMVRDNDHKSLFNMPLKETKAGPYPYVTDVFTESVKMSTYLVAFVILPNDYQSVNGTVDKQQGKLEIGIHAPKDMITDTYFSLNVTKKVLPFFEDLFGQEYPLPKLDMIGVPDFGAGAMENWGLITYRFLTLLYDPASKQAQHMQNVAEVVSHEIAHQWFGNIVTMTWWSDLWLNEGFATFTQYLGTDVYEPQWKMMDQFYLNTYQAAMSFDSILHSHPILVPVNDPHEIESIFDDISYFKGASLIRMLESVVGQASLKSGLKIYLKRFRYRNAASSDLWQAITEGYALENPNMDDASPSNNLTRVMATWLEQMNYPLVTFKRTGTNKFTLRQERYLVYPNASSLWTSQYTSPFQYLWIIPVKYITDSQKEAKMVWLNLQRENEFILDHTPKWIKINWGQNGFYLQNYDVDNWNKLIEQLEIDHNVFSAADRAGLINDAFFLVRSGKLDIDVALKLSRYLVRETEYAPWQTALHRYSDILNMVYFDGDLYKKLKKFMRSLVGQVLKDSKFKWDANSLAHMESLTRNAVFQFAINCDEPTSMKEAKELFTKYKVEPKFDDENLKILAFQVGISEGTEEDWDFLWKKYKTNSDPQEKRVIQRALASTRDTQLLYRMLMHTVNSSDIRMQDSVTSIQEISKNPVARDLAWIFMRRYWFHFHKHYSGQAFLMAELIKICNTMSSDYDYDTAKEFFEKNNLGSGTRSSLQALENIKSNIYWKEKNYQKMKDWFNKNVR